MKKAVILCAGAGSKIWPYNRIRCKAMIPVSNKPCVAHSVDILCELGFEDIVIVGNLFVEEVKAYFAKYANVKVITDNAPKGTAFSLLKARELMDGEDFLCLYGDTVIDKSDIEALIDAFDSGKDNAVLADSIRSRADDCIGCEIEDGKIAQIWGHSGEATHFFAAFALKGNIFETLERNSGRFTNVEVGMMPHIEGYLEMSLSDLMCDGEEITAVTAQKKVFNLDKPWHIMEANCEINKRRCEALKENELAEGAAIDETAVIKGFVKLGKNSSIGSNVIIEGNIIVGDNTRIYNGAIIQGNTVIGNECAVRNACFIAEGSTVGDDCVISHAAELEGVVFRRVYLYHYMEFYGVIGENTDLGAATVCGTLRFDNGITAHRCKGRKEYAECFGDASFLGDYCRTGVNAILMPGVKIGAYSVVGAGVLLNKDVPDNTLIYTKQELVEKPWGSEVYGW